MCLCLALSGCATTGNVAGKRSYELDAEEQRLASALAHFAQGLIYQVEYGRSSPEAIEQFSMASRLDPGVRRINSRMAAAFLKKNHPEKAIEALEKACGENPDSVGAWVELAMTCQLTGRPDKAIEYFRKALSLKRDRTFIYVALAGLYLETEDLTKAIRILEDGFSKSEHPDLILAYCCSRALDFLRLGALKKAIRFFECADANAGPNPAEALSEDFYLFHGSAHERDGDLASAEQVFKKCLALYPEAHSCMNYMAYMWAEEGIKLDEALEYAKKAVELDKNNPAYLDTLGWVQFKKMDYDSAARNILRALDLMPNDPTIAEHLGDIFAASGNMESAVQYWSRSMRIDPANSRLAKKLYKAGVEPKTPATSAREPATAGQDLEE